MTGSSGHAAVAFLAAITAAACYSYSPVQSPQPGMEVRARLNSEAAVHHSQGLEAPILQYDGVLVDVATDSISVDVLVARSSSAFQDVVIRDTVSLGMTEIQSLMERKISPTKSALATVGIAAAAVAVVAGIDAVVGGTDNPPNGGNPTFRIPLFSHTASRLVSILIGGR